jgi:hypothetical protein
MGDGVEVVRLAVGAFLTSPGFGGLAALGAAYVADERERWWQSYTHLWDNRDDIHGPLLLAGIQSLGEVAETTQQRQRRTWHDPERRCRGA